MSFIERRVRLASDPGGLGLSCTTDGLSLAGAPLLRKTASGFEPRPEAELRVPLAAAYGDAAEPQGLGERLDAIARIGGYAADPSKIFYKLKRYVDAAANYQPRQGVWMDIHPSQIKEREIQVAIPEYTSDAQWKQINNAIEYANRRDVKLVITRIR